MKASDHFSGSSNCLAEFGAEKHLHPEVFRIDPANKVLSSVKLAIPTDVTSHGERQGASPRG